MKTKYVKAGGSDDDNYRLGDVKDGAQMLTAQVMMAITQLVIMLAIEEQMQYM